MAPALKLYIGNRNYSSWSMRPWVLMREAQIPFEDVLVRFDSFEPDSQFKRTLRGLSPTGKVPVLETQQDGGRLLIWDTLAISEYLAERFPERGLWPESVAQRARARSVVAEMHAGFGALRRVFPMNIEASLPEVGERMLAEHAEVAADLARITSLWTECLEASGGPCLFGRFGVADAFFAPVVMRMRTYALPLPAQARRYADHLAASASVSEWMSLALAEHDFREFEEPYRGVSEAAGALPPPGSPSSSGRQPLPDRPE